MKAPELFAWLVFVVCLALSFLLSGMEAGVFALSRMRVRQQMRAGRRSAKVLHGYLENPENFLWTILVGNTIANFIILGMVLVILDDALPGDRIWFAVIFLVVVFLFYTLCDLLPKMLFRLYPNRLSLFFARPFRLIHALLRPLVWMVQGISALVLRWTGGKAFTGHLFGNREELRFIMQESGGTLSTEERAMINRVLDLQSLTVRHIAKPISLAATATMESPIKEVIAVSRNRQITRLPVWETREGRRRIAGIISMVTILYLEKLDPNRPTADFVRPALYVEEDLRLESALQRMQRSGQRLAVVLGRDRREIGIITLTDILKLIFGEVNL
ncbi:MAG TPA: CNNM domain-containing protein [Verrucomicrobiae bacterium]|jgi:putative hemolysin|nr:CNNM domain-containing protein [Verrucomicrobiae bacterium]